MTAAEYKPLFSYFGGKSRIAYEVWAALGDVENYVEPFFGSGAVFFMRPSPRGPETLNDADGFVANFWRAVKADPDAVADWADNPVFENDLHARHVWLRAQADGLVPRLEGDPDYYDAKVAGWWAWGMSVWIGGGWCGEGGSGPWSVEDGSLVRSGIAGSGVSRQVVQPGNGGQGVVRKLPHPSNTGRGVTRCMPHLGDTGRGICKHGPGDTGDGAGRRRAFVRAMFSPFAERLAEARVCCGDWKRVTGPAVTTRHGPTGVFLDPPYAPASWCGGVYSTESDVTAEVCEWCRANGDNPLLRIVLCGYAGDYDLPGWRQLGWKAKGGYGNHSDGRGRENSHRETLWLSPACTYGGLFD